MERGIRMLKFLKSIPGMIKHNFWLKLLSFALAFVVWVIVVAYYNPETTDTIEGIPITVDFEQSVLQEQGLMLVTVPKTNVDVKIEGKREKIAAIGKDKVTAFVSVASVTKPGEYDLPVNIAIDGQSVKSVSQSVKSLKLRFEKAINTQFTVDVITKGEVAEGYVLEKIATPTIITLTGPESVVEKIASVQAVVSQEQFTESGIFDATLLYLDKNGEKLDDTFLTADAVKVNISVFKEKTVPLQVELVNGSGGNDTAYLQVKIEPETIKIAGSTEVLESINYISLGTVDVSEIEKTVSKDIPLIMPNGVKSADAVENAKVSFGLDGTVTKQFEISTKKIGLENLPDGMDVSIPEGKLNITVRGDAADLGKLQETDISPKIDFKNQKMTKGSNRMTVYCVFPESYKVGVVGKYEVTVTVS